MLRFLGSLILFLAKSVPWFSSMAISGTVGGFQFGDTDLPSFGVIRSKRIVPAISVISADCDGLDGEF
jgi:hypothetical protein